MPWRNEVEKKRHRELGEGFNGLEDTRDERIKAEFGAYWGGLFRWSAAGCHLLSLGARRSMKKW